MKCKGFTLVELLVVVTIIGMLTAMVFGALQVSRKTAMEAKTKATIAKLNNIIMRRYESYMTRRVPISTRNMSPTEAAQARLDALRDIMRMEMPDAATDVANGPVTFSWGSVPEPALHHLYAANPPTGDHDGAQCLYMIVSMAEPESMEQFNQSEIGTTADGRMCFVDAWGDPIMFLRWAPGYRSPIQSGDADNDHDPYDVRGVDGFAFHMIPLIYSARGRKNPATGDPQYGIDLQAGYVFAGNPYECMELGQFMPGEGGEGNIDNHHLDQR